MKNKKQTKKSVAYNLFDAGYTNLDDVCAKADIKPGTAQVYYNQWQIDTGRREPKYSKLRMKNYFDAEVCHEPLSCTHNKVGLQMTGYSAKYHITEDKMLVITVRGKSLVLTQDDARALSDELVLIKGLF